LKEGALFDELDKDTKGWLSLQDLFTFLQSYTEDASFQMAERCFRRIDEDNDDRVLYDEFLRAFRPMYSYKSFEHYIPQAKDISPSKIYQKTHEPAPLRKKKIQKKVTLNSSKGEDWEETKNLPSKKGTTTLSQTKHSYETIGNHIPRQN